MNCISSQNFSTTNNIHHVSYSAKKASNRKNRKRETLVLFHKVPRKQVIMITGEKKSSDETIISTMLECIFNQCRRVPQSAQSIFLVQGTHSLDYTCTYPRKENIDNMIQLLNITSSYRETARITFELYLLLLLRKLVMSGFYFLIVIDLIEKNF